MSTVIVLKEHESYRELTRDGEPVVHKVKSIISLPLARAKEMALAGIVEFPKGTHPPDPPKPRPAPERNR